MKPAVLGRSVSGASADPPLLPPSSRSSLMRGGSTGADQDAARTYKSKFKRALRRVDVPPALQQGIPVMRVYANGEKPRKQYLTLSRDKFTLYITSKPMDSRHFQDEKKSKTGSWFSLRRTSSMESVSSSKRGGVDLSETAEGSRNRANKEVRAIDIGAIHRIQRGAHNANLKTTTTSAATVQNLSRRTRSDLKKGRPDSFSSRISPVSSPNSSNHNLNNSNHQMDSNIYNPFDIDNQANVPFDFKNPNFIPEAKSSTGRFSWSTIKSHSTAATSATTALDPGMCFSIIFRGDWTLDLMMTDFDIMTTKTASTRDSLSSSKDDNSASSASRITRDTILDALDNLVKAYQSAKRQVSNDVLLLRYVWSEADQVRTTPSDVFYCVLSNQRMPVFLIPSFFSCMVQNDGNRKWVTLLTSRLKIRDNE